MSGALYARRRVVRGIEAQDDLPGITGFADLLSDKAQAS